MKLLGSLIASLALGLSVLVAVPTTATAAPYPGTVATSCSYNVPDSVTRNRNLNVRYRVTASGNARPSGVVTFKVWKVTNSGWEFNRSFSNRYTGPGLGTRSLGKFKKTGHFATRVYFRPPNGSVYKSSSSDAEHFRVTR